MDSYEPFIVSKSDVVHVNGTVEPAGPDAVVIGTTYAVLLSYSLVARAAYHCVPLSKKVADRIAELPE